jgi:hypothetical protein
MNNSIELLQQKTVAIIKGIGAIGAIELTQQLPPELWAEAGKLVVQIIIGVATLVNLFKSNKSDKGKR